MKLESAKGTGGGQYNLSGIVREIAEKKVEAQSLASDLADREERIQDLVKKVRGWGYA